MADAGRKPVVFTDVDGTLCFHEEANGIERVRQEPGGLLVVRDPRSARVFEAHDVSTSSYAVFLAEETRRNFTALSRSCDVVLVTGGRPSTCQRRAPLLNFASGIIAENGGVIFDADFHRDEVWWERLAPQRKLLAEVKAYIESYGWRLDDAGRTSGIRVRLRDNPHKNAEKFARLIEVVRLPSGLQSTINLNNLDIILQEAGKDKAVAYYLESRGYDPGLSHAIGDDINDLAFLRVCRYQYVLSSAYPEVLAEARSQGWFISGSPTFEGIHQVLEEIGSGVR